MSKYLKYAPAADAIKCPKCGKNAFKEIIKITGVATVYDGRLIPNNHVQYVHVKFDLGYALKPEKFCLVRAPRIEEISGPWRESYGSAK